MDRREYLQALDRALHPLASRREREDILRYYEEYFDEAGSEKEEAVIALLGDPVDLARSTAQGAKPYPLPDGEGPDPDDPAERGPSARKLIRWAKRRWWWLAAVGACLIAAIVLAAALRPHDNGLPEGFPAMEPLLPEGITPTVCTEPLTLEAAFASIRVEAGAANIRVKQGAKQGVSLRWQRDNITDYGFSYCVEGGVLYITGSSPGETVDVDMLDAWVEITVPQGTTLEQVAVSTGTGDIEISNVEARTILAQTGIGDVALRGGKDQGAEAVGLTTGVGNIYQSGAPARKLWAETGTGGIWLRPDCGRDACSYELRSGGMAGVVTVDGESAGKQAVQKEESPNLRPYHVTAATKKGSIALEFLYQYQRK